MDPARYTTACLLGLLVGVAFAPAAPAQPPPLSAERLESALAGERADAAAALRAMYQARGSVPVWTAQGGLTTLGHALARELALAWQDGLDPEAYGAQYVPPSFGSDLNRAQRRAEVLRMDEVQRRRWTGAERAQEETEVALGAALLRLARDLSAGRTEPARIYDDWRATRTPISAEEVLRLAVTAGPAAALGAARPQHAEYARLQAALRSLLETEARGGWALVPGGPAIRLGDEDPAVPALRARLGLPARVGGDAERFDAALDAAVRTAQGEHGLEADGVVGPLTRAALNVSAGGRALQVAANLERWRWLPDSLGAARVVIDVAAMRASYVESGEALDEQRAVVGALRHPTPGFTSAITHVVLSPYWNVPASIARNEIWPLVARDPGYLARHQMRVVEGGRLRQDPGPANPLGPAKFIFDTPFGVRLHGTSEPHLFRRHRRAFSHGCVRIEDPVRLAVRLAEPAGWDAERVRDAAGTKRERWIRLPQPIAIHAVYWTAVAGEDGKTRFRPDLYGRDRPLLLALAAEPGAVPDYSSLPAGRSVGEGVSGHTLPVFSFAAATLDEVAEASGLEGACPGEGACSGAPDGIGAPDPMSAPSALAPAAAGTLLPVEVAPSQALLVEDGCGV